MPEQTPAPLPPVGASASELIEAEVFTITVVAIMVTWDPSNVADADIDSVSETFRDKFDALCQIQ